MFSFASERIEKFFSLIRDDVLDQGFLWAATAISAFFGSIRCVIPLLVPISSKHPIYPHSFLYYADELES